MKQQIFINDIHEYDYELVGNQHVLSYSNAEQWTKLYKGQVASTIQDDGNGLLLSLYNGSRCVFLQDQLQDRCFGIM